MWFNNMFGIYLNGDNTKKLKDKKYRDEEKKYIVEGIKKWVEKNSKKTEKK